MADLYISEETADDVETAAVERRRHDVGTTGRRPKDHEIAGGRDLCHPFAQHASQLVRGRDAVRRELRDRVDTVATRNTHLDSADVLEIARDGGLCGVDPLVGQEADQLLLARDLVVAEQSGDELLALDLGRHGRTPNR